MVGQDDWREKIQPLNEQVIAKADLYNEYARIGEMLEGGMDVDDAAYLIFGPDLAFEAMLRLES